MKKSINKICAFAIFASMMMSCMSYTYAETDTANAPEAPEKPQAESYLDNDKIEEYNSKIDAYNEAALKYNRSIDEEYEKAVRDTDETNEEIALHNASEEQRVKEAQERNEQAQKDAEDANARIDEENAARKAQAEQDVENKYQSDIAQYEKDLAQYEYDRTMESKILSLGYSSVEQYNNTVNSYYNEPAKLSVQKNADAKELSAKDTYTVEEAFEKSGKMITVSIEHRFQGIDKSYVEEFQIDANDMITVKTLASAAESTMPGYATFYYNTDESHQMGYWAESYSCIETNAKYNQSGWDHGDSHTISLKDGTNHLYDDESIVVVYEYFWVPLRTVKTYNTPQAPTVPVKGEASYEEAMHVSAELENITDADIRELLTAPVKRAYLDILGHMELFQVPATAIPATDESEPGIEAEDTAADTASASLSVDAEVPMIVINDEDAPLTPAVAEADQKSIVDQVVPMAAPEGSWALVNLIAAILTVALSVVIIMFGIKKEDENDEEETGSRGRKIRVTLLGISTAIISVIAFILTENMTLTMQMVDEWTIVMIIALAFEAVLLMASLKTRYSDEDNEITTAI